MPLAGLEPARSLNRGILSPLRLPIPPQRHIHNLLSKPRLGQLLKNQLRTVLVQSFLEAPPRFELGVKVLQTRALPLGYGAISACVFAVWIIKKQHGYFGAGNEIRTRDIHLGKVTLYH